VNNRIEFETEDAEVIRLDDPVLVVVGFSARDSKQVETHIAELREYGIEPPAEIPGVWSIPNDLLTMKDSTIVTGDETSGEVEPVLILRGTRRFLTVGSDHTDRLLEKSSIPEAKRACEKVVSQRCWSLEKVTDEWDELELSSEVRVAGAWTPYQRATLDSLLHVDWFLERFADNSEKIIFMGTVPVIGGLDTKATEFRGELRGGNNSLQVSYRIERGR
jgi:hypothetical protein